MHHSNIIFLNILEHNPFFLFIASVEMKVDVPIAQESFVAYKKCFFSFNANQFRRKWFKVSKSLDHSKK